MTLATKYRRGAALPAAALGALLLAGCSSGNVGESWQCPLVEAGTCDSVAAADPAVPDMNAAETTVLGEPLWRVRASDRYEAPAERPCEADCGGFDPFAWLARLFGAEAADGGEKTAVPGPVRLLPAEAPGPLPAEPDVLETDDGGEVARDDHDDLRTDEVVARIWIAPFVDADGVYREASHVRVVLQPASWRLK